MSDPTVTPTPTEVPFWRDIATGEPCPRSGPVLCTITDPNHLHRAIHMDAPAPSAPDLDAIRARADAATPGPWFREFGDVITSEPDPRAKPWQEEPPAARVVRRAEHRHLRDDQGVADAAFIAHAREDVPALLAALAAAHAEVALLRSLAQGAEETADTNHAGFVRVMAERDEARAALAAVRAEADRLRLALTDEIGKTVAAEAALAALREQIEGLADEWQRAGDAPDLWIALRALAAAPSETPRERVVRLSEDLAAGCAIHDPSGREVAPSETEEGR